MSDTTQKYDDVLKRFRNFYDYGLAASAENRKQGDLDMKALSIIGPIPEAELKSRQEPTNQRPHGHTDVISQYNDRIVNQARMNPRGIKVIPIGEGADENTAGRRADRIRAIEYESKALKARLTALQNAVDRGYGYWRVDVDYVSPRSRNLKVVVRRIPNPNAVIDDPDSTEEDRSDRRRLIVGEWTTMEQAKARFPHMKDPKGMSTEMLGGSAMFYREDGGRIFLAEYWEVQETTETLYFFNGSPDGVFKSELPEGAVIDDGVMTLPGGQSIPVDDERKGTRKEVCQYFTNGIEVFEKKEWRGSWIPFPGCFGREKYEGDNRVLESNTRKAREPQLSFDVARWSEQEQLLMAPKAKWVISDKAIKGFEEQWKMAHRSPQAYLTFHERDEQNNQVNMPQYQAHEPQVQAYELAASSYIRDIQNAVGMASVERIDRTSKSGIAQDRIDENTNIVKYHFMDSFISGTEFEGRIINELLDKIEDTQRNVGFQNPEGQYQVRQLNVMQNADGSIEHEYGDGEAHDVTISTGPSYQSQHDEAIETLRKLAENPEFAQNPIAPMIIQGMQLGPLGDKMKKVLMSILPPHVAAAYNDKGGGEEQIALLMSEKQKMDAMVKQLDGYVKQLEGQVDELNARVQSQMLLIESKERISNKDNETEMEIAKLKAMVEKMKLENDLEKERVKGMFALKKQDLANEATAGENDMDRLMEMRNGNSE